MPVQTFIHWSCCCACWDLQKEPWHNLYHHLLHYYCALLLWKTCCACLLFAPFQTCSLVAFGQWKLCGACTRIMSFCQLLACWFTFFWWNHLPCLILPLSIFVLFISVNFAFGPLRSGLSFLVSWRAASFMLGLECNEFLMLLGFCAPFAKAHELVVFCFCLVH